MSGAAALAAGPAPAHAQVAGSVTLESQDVYRGVSLDNHQPDLRVAISYDHPSGAYAGLSGVAGLTARDGVRLLSYTGYAGYARQAFGGLTWDAGVTATSLVIYLKARSAAAFDGPTSTYRYKSAYAEAYVGLSRGGLSGRLYLSPDYLHQGGASAYLDLNRDFSFSRALGAYLHAGLFTPLGGSNNPYAERERPDVGAGGSWSLPLAQLRLGWSFASPAIEYPPGYRQRDERVVISVAHFF